MPTATLTQPRLSTEAEKLHDLLDDIGGSVSLAELSYHLGKKGSEVMDLLVELELAGLARATYFEAVADG